MKAHNDWKPFLQEEIQKPYYNSLSNFLIEQEKNNKKIFPEKKNWFNALSVSPKDVKVVIIGQDPYHGENQAHGYSFSVEKGVKAPPSLVNIYKEIESEFGYEMSKKNGNLTPWVEQGVMLLNAVLTVEKGIPAAHKGKGWEMFTDKIIESLSQNFENKVFLLWGAFAQGKQNLIDDKKHLVLKSAHPSPYSAANGFFGNNHFKKANDYLKSKGIEEINWQIKEE